MTKFSKLDINTILKSGTDYWNNWRKLNPELEIDLTGNIYDGLKMKFGADLSSINFGNCKFINCDFSGANLQNSNFQKTDFLGTSLRKTNCHHTKFCSSKIKKCTFDRASLEGADFSKTLILDSNFCITNATGLNLKDAILERLEYPTNGTEAEMFGTSILELSFAKNLELINKKSHSFLLKYITGVYEYINKQGQKDEFKLYRDNEFISSIFIDSVPEERSKEYFTSSINQINSIYNLINNSVVPNDLIVVTEYINAKLLKELKENPNKIHELHWRGFEELIAEILASYGWKVTLTAKTRDNGFDIFAINKDISGVQQSWLIECKKWSIDRPVGIDVIRSLYTVKNDLSVGNIMLATSSYFSPEVYKYQSSKFDLDLRDYSKVIDWINDYKPNPNGKLYIKQNRLICP